jgi:hypothetical protein
MASLSTYYFSSTRYQEGSASVSTAFKFAYMKHAGSLALGSLLLTIVQILRAAAEILERGSRRNGHIIGVVVSLCVRCFIQCLEEFLIIFDRAALGYMAVSGESYCTSGMNGFLLLWKHLFSFYFARRIARTLVFMGVMIMLAMNLLFFWLIMKKSGYLDELEYSLLPFAIVCYSSLFISHTFLGLFNAAVTGTLICLGIDMDLNQGQPANGPPDLHDKLDKVFNVDKAVVVQTVQVNQYQ